MRGTFPVVVASTALFAPGAMAQSVSDMSVAQEFVIAAVFGDEAGMRAQLSPSARFAVSDGRLMNNGRLNKKAEAVDLITLSKFFFRCQFQMAMGSHQGIHVDICVDQGPEKQRLARFLVEGGKVVSVTISRGWANPPAKFSLPGRD